MKHSCIQIGNGKIARSHRDVFPSIVEVTALIVRDVKKHQEQRATDPSLNPAVPVFSTVEDALHAVGKPFFWDIASDDETHLHYIHTILAQDPTANIALAKTFYDPEKRKEYDTLRASSQAKIHFIENYAHTPVVTEIKKIMQQKNMHNNLNITIDFTKNRAKDILHGRFLQKDCGVLCYEGSHILTILHRLGKQLHNIHSFEDTPLLFPDGTILEHNGHALLTAQTQHQDHITLYTSMDGQIKYSIPELQFGGNIPFGDERRHRVIIIEDPSQNIKIIGQFDPIPNLPRFVGRILVFEHNTLTQRIENIPENTLKTAFTEIIDYFQGKKPNSFDPALFDGCATLYHTFSNYKSFSTTNTAASIRTTATSCSEKTS